MDFKRAAVYEGGLQRAARAGDGCVGCNYIASAITADSNQTITVAQMSGGLILRSGATAGRTDTSDTAAHILAAYPGMDIGDTLSFKVSNTSTQTITLAGGTGVTASGNLAIPTLTMKEVVIRKTSATTVDMIAL